MPNETFAKSPLSIGSPIASTPGTVVGKPGGDIGGVGPAIAVTESVTFRSVQAARRTIPATIHVFRIARHRSRLVIGACHPFSPCPKIGYPDVENDHNPATTSRGGVCLAALPGCVPVRVRA